VPWQVARLALTPENRFVQCSTIARIVRQQPGMRAVDALLVDDPRQVGIESIIKPKALFYRPTDLYADLKSDKAFTRAERLLLDRCDGVIATSKPVLDHVLRLKPGLRNLVLTNGVDVGHFSTPMPEPSELQAIPHPRVVYVGAVDDRFDVALMALLADALPEVHSIIIGPGPNLEKLRALGKANIHVLGPRPYRQIPGYLQACDVALMPLTDDAANSGRSPMKLYEFAAAGLPVVALATDELRRRNEAFVRLYSNHEQVVPVVRSVIHERPNRSEMTRYSRPHDWTAKASSLLEFLNGSSLDEGPSDTECERLCVR
jgi:glycosyltransferase involved in cell wall biosynthesis